MDLEGFSGQAASVAAIQLYHYSMKAVKDNKMNYTDSKKDWRWSSEVNGR